MCRERRYVDHDHIGLFSQIYFRMHHFVVRFIKFSSSQAARGHWPPNHNPADVPENVTDRSEDKNDPLTRSSTFLCAAVDRPAARD